MAKYRFNQSGAGVPGLPHEITDQEVSQFNPEQLGLWHAALESGVYVEVTDASRKPVRKSRKSDVSDEGEQV